jgi:hypothetical protein
VHWLKEYHAQKRWQEDQQMAARGRGAWSWLYSEVNRQHMSELQASRDAGASKGGRLRRRSCCECWQHVETASGASTTSHASVLLSLRAFEHLGGQIAGVAKSNAKDFIGH